MSKTFYHSISCFSPCLAPCTVQAAFFTLLHFPTGSGSRLITSRKHCADSRDLRSDGFTDPEPRTPTVWNGGHRVFRPSVRPTLTSAVRPHARATDRRSADCQTVRPPIRPSRTSCNKSWSSSGQSSRRQTTRRHDVQTRNEACSGP